MVRVSAVQLQLFRATMLVSEIDAKRVTPVEKASYLLSVFYSKRAPSIASTLSAGMLNVKKE